MLPEPEKLGRPLIRVDRVDSTMLLAGRLADHGAPHGTTVIAGHQEAGRGRAGRAWQDEPGANLLMSIVLHLPEPLAASGRWSPLIGLAVARATDRWLPVTARVKWPNDVLVGDRKLAGILIQASTSGAGSRLIVGIGLNVNIPGDRLPDGATGIQAELGESVAVTLVARAVLDEIGVVLTSEANASHFALNERLAWRGRLVSIEDGDRLTHGTVEGVERDGTLVLRREEGTRACIVAGELVRGPRPIIR